MERESSRSWILLLGVIAAVSIGVSLALLAGISPILFNRSISSEEYGFPIVTEDFGKSSTPSIQQTAGQVEQSKTISVTGTGVVKAKPDRVVISFSVVTQADTAEEALSENAAKMDSVIRAVRAAGILENQTETSAYSINPVWEYPDRGSPKIVGYTCSNTIKVTVKNLNKVGEIIDIAASAGVNQVSSLQFTISEEAVSQLGLDALSLAVRDAASKARTIADAAGVTLVGPLSISLSSYSPYVRSYAFESIASSIPTPILSPEEVSVTVSVSAVYEFR
ncbi:MAG: SIMPL domain-containing protein [Thermoproteota archaeon]